MTGTAASGDPERRAPTGPLAGFRIVDMTSVLMGPFATQILGDYGADVVKIESREGDLIRLAGAMRNPKMGSLFLHNNRNKRSVVLDMKSELGRQAILKLCQQSDVLVSNIRPAAMKRLGLSHDDVRAVNPSIVYAPLVGYGQSGPYADRPAYDDLIQGISAIPSLISAFVGRPQYVPLTAADRIVGMAAVGSEIARKWYDEGDVDAIAAVPNSSVALAVQEVARQKHKMLLVTGAATADLTGKFCSPYMAHWTDDTFSLSSGTVRALLAAGKKTFFFITADYAYGTSVETEATRVIRAERGRW